MTATTTIPRCDRQARHRVTARILPRVRRVYRCDHGGLPGIPPSFYRRVGRGRWEMSPDATFELGFAVPERSRAEIEANGHVLVPVEVAAGGDLR